jgi:hypothetical protein
MDELGILLPAQRRAPSEMTRAIGARRRRPLVAAADGAFKPFDEAAVHRFEFSAWPVADACVAFMRGLASELRI